jgi:hypothetical protein
LPFIFKSLPPNSPRGYNITVPPQLNVSSHQSFNDSNASSVDHEEDTLYIFKRASDVSDSESIFKLIADYFAGGYQVIQKLLSTTVSTLNISVARLTLILTVEMGYNLTLFFNPFMVYTLAAFGGCTNKTLDGFPIEVTTPHFTKFGLNHSYEITALAGRFLVKKKGVFE